MKQADQAFMKRHKGCKENFGAIATLHNNCFVVVFFFLWGGGGTLQHSCNNCYVLVEPRFFLLVSILNWLIMSRNLPRAAPISAVKNHQLLGGSFFRTCKSLITMLGKSPKDRVVPLANGLFTAYKWGLPSTY